MKKFLLLLAISLNSCSTADFYGDVDLGGNLFYIVDPSFNSIDFATGPKYDPMQTATPIIKDIEFIGFNDTCILIITKNNGNSRYWSVDKSKDTKLVSTSKDSLSRISNLSLVDSISFNKLRSLTKIDLLSKTHYRKKFDYE